MSVLALLAIFMKSVRRRAEKYLQWRNTECTLLFSPEVRSYFYAEHSLLVQDFEIFTI